ncbi:MAG: hypothetical protein HZY73_05795 [Micropruina sp.]|nr:MAG: hypothetical protein HZY73_05795 [Micropruina sp.]
MTALLAPKNTNGGRKPWASLRAVAAPDRRLSSLPFILMVALFMAFGMVGLLVLNTSLQDQAFEVRKQQRIASELGYQLAALEAQATDARSATQLAIRASGLGMRPNPYPIYLTLPDGRIVGDPTAVTGGELPEVRYRTPSNCRRRRKHGPRPRPKRKPRPRRRRRRRPRRRRRRRRRPTPRRRRRRRPTPRRSGKATADGA